MTGGAKAGGNVAQEKFLIISGEHAKWKGHLGRERQLTKLYRLLPHDPKTHSLVLFVCLYLDFWLHLAVL